MRRTTMWVWGIVILVLVALVSWWVYAISTPGNYDEFAQCLKDKGAIFYGAFWCPHCKAQKAMFGKSVSKLPYVECSNPDGQSQTQICIDKGITSYPTWVFADGSRLSGEIPLATLAEKTSCVLPK